MKEPDRFKFTPRYKFESPFVDASSESIPNLVDGALSQIIEDINQKKQQIIINKCKELGLEIDWELEKTRRFKSILVEDHKDTGAEIYFYNDGTPEGIRIVTFIRNDSDYNDVNIMMGYSYF